jgi:hypothetical protein
MKRMLLTATAASALALGAPAVASAHHKHHHKHRSTQARVLLFKSRTVPASPTTTSSPTAPSSDPAGTVTSFKEGVLTITLADGSVVTGKVNEQTRLECQSATGQEAGERDDQGGGDDQSGRDSGEHGGPVTSARISDFQGGDDQGEDGQGAQESCTTAALVPGAKVGEAELLVASGGSVWEKVDLLS